ncbi:MAG TPA: outer membrane beta-barrel protein [Burkholderiales bacterium]|nr:outer membrane beta-barrel protein [Burkholderiales bacterium]
MHKKHLIATAVAAAFALPVVAMAEDPKPAAPAAPTLTQVLDSSGITMSGYLDVGYTHANRELEPGPTDRVFDSYNNSFLLHQAAVTVAKQPKEGFGGLINLTMGQDAKVINASDGNSSDNFNVTQAYAQYATGAFTIIGGKFTTLQGTEVIATPSDVNISRSLLFFGEPVTHVGVRGTYAVNDKISLIAGINNGIISSDHDPNGSKTLELGATFAPIKPVSIAISNLHGNETTAAFDGARNSFDAVVSWTVIDPLTLGVEYLNVTQDGIIGTNDKFKYSGIAGYASYMITPKFRASLRAEWMKDDDGLLFGVTDNKMKETTLTLAYLPTDNFELRAEVRGDHSDKPFFLNTDSVTSEKSLTTYAVEGIYKF